MLSGPGGNAFRVGLALNVLGPIVAYQVLSRLGVGPVPALAAAAVLPLAGTVRGWLRSGRLDAVGGLSLLFIALGIVVAVATDNALVLLLKGSVANAAYAALCLASLLWRRPLLFYVGRQFATGGDRAAMERYDGLWEAPAFRASQRRATVVWALWGLTQAGLRTALALQLPIGTFLLVWRPLDVVVTVGLVAWTVSLTRQAAASASVGAGGANVGAAEPGVAVAPAVV